MTCIRHWQLRSWRAPAVHSLDRIWRRIHAASSSITLAAPWLPGVGHPDRDPALDLSVNLGGVCVVNLGIYALRFQRRELVGWWEVLG